MHDTINTPNDCPSSYVYLPRRGRAELNTQRAMCNIVSAFNVLVGGFNCRIVCNNLIPCHRVRVYRALGRQAQSRYAACQVAPPCVLRAQHILRN